jgi:putative chitinase
MTPDLHLGDTQLILKECKLAGLLRNQAAYVMATAWWETAHTVEPVKEAYWVKNAEAWRKKNLRYYPWYGRGYVQLTWERNYIHAGKQLGLDLTTNPESVMVPDVSAKILVTGSLEGWFTGKKLGDYITISKSDFKGARRIINGTDKAAAIATIARAYDAALKVSGYGMEASANRATFDWWALFLKLIAFLKTFGAKK